MTTQLALVPTAIEQLKQTIATEWQRAEKRAKEVIAAFIRIGKCIRLAEDRLINGTTAYESFLGELPFSKSHAVKFKKLAENPVITKKSNFGKLPPSIYSLYQLALLDPEELQGRLDAGLVDAQTTRDQIAKFKQQDSYQPFCTVSISPSLTSKDRVALIASASQTFTKYPDLKFKLSKAVQQEGLVPLRARAEREYERLVAKYPPERRRFSSLVDHAIEAIRKNPKHILPPNFGRRDQLKRDLGIDTSQEIRRGDLYKAARHHKVICRFLPLVKHDPHLKLWVHVIECCETGSAKKLERLANEKIQGKKTAKEKKDAIAQARSILDEYRMFLNA